MTTKSIKEIEKQLHKITDENDPIINECKHDERKGVQQLVTRWFKQRKETETYLLRFNEMSVYEKDLYQKNYQYVAGVDEVGRGPLAGPVVAAAVILPKDIYLPGLDDSKKLTKKKRELLFDHIVDQAISIGLGIISAEKIDEVNIYQASKLAMCQAVEQLTVTPDYLLIDAMEIPNHIPQTPLVKGDSRSISIAASSVIAKVTRDRLMIKLGLQYPRYGFEQHMGYGTKSHIEAIKQYGVIGEHRRSFSPVSEELAKKKE